MNPISNTAYYCCGVRMEDAARKKSVCNDIYAKRFMDARAMEIFAPFKSERMPNITSITRCRIIDDLIAEEIRSNDSTYIFTIGAGFDTRPYRLTGGRWIEVDEPQVIEYKNKKLPAEECGNPLIRIAIDFSTESLPSKLTDLDNDLPIVIVIEGVFMYLEPGQISKTVMEIKSLFPKHILVCDLLTKIFFEKFGASIHAKIVGTGASFTTPPENPQQLFIQNNYVEVESIPIVRRAIELGVIWDQLIIPDFAAKLTCNVFVQELNEYKVHCFNQR
jgi:methyltransferase (TIGR00027 family)